MADLAGTTIGQYRLDSLLGRGGMADVYFATHVTSGRKVALKLVRIDEISNGERRFLSEAQLLSNLDHPNIVRLFDFFESKGCLALAIEYVPGRCLDEILEDRKMRPDEALDIFRKILPPLSYLHERGIVHRDIKPSNIRVMPDGEVKLLDFGIARTTGTKRLTRVGRVVGTPAYLSPEIRSGEEPKPAADVWALGMLLKECAEDWCERHGPGLHSVRLTPTEKTFKRVLAKCLERRPEDRYPSALAIERDLDLQRLTGSFAATPSWDKRSVIGISIAAAIVVLFLVLIFRGGSNAPPELAPAARSGAPLAQGTTGMPSSSSTPLRSIKPDGASPSPINGTGNPLPDASDTVPVHVALLAASSPAELYIDDQDAGQISSNPSVIQLAPGTHKFEVRQNGEVICPAQNDSVAGQHTFLNFATPLPNQ